MSFIEKRTVYNEKIYSSLFLLQIASVLISNAQVTNSLTKKNPPKTIWDIPHQTLREKWMWIHRSITFEIIKERPIKCDTNYIRSYNKHFTVILPVNCRFLRFSLIDSKTGNKLTYSPNFEYNLGISISSRWGSFILNSGVKLYNSDTEIKGKTSYQDYQLNLYSRKFTTDMFFQFYNGFYIKNSKTYSEYVSEKPFLIRDDVYAINMGVSSYYVLNNKRFSYKSSFAFTEQQKKSAGSVLVGIYYSYFEASGHHSLVAPPFRSHFDTLSFIRNGHTHFFGFNLGYIYTLVFLKKCYITASAVQGVGAENLAYQRDDSSIYRKLEGGAGKLNIRMALGFDNKRYFAGAIVMFDYYLFRGQTNPTFDYSFGNFMIFTGYRFNFFKQNRKVLHRLKLVDY